MSKMYNTNFNQSMFANTPNQKKPNESKISKLSSLDSRRKSSIYRIKTQKTNNLGKCLLYKVKFGSTNPELKNKNKYGNNTINTTKYNLFTFIPKNLLFQFTRVSNIYFLIVSILTFMNFSPKEPASMLGTFIFVLFCTLVKDGIEDLGRYKQDRISNNRTVLKFSDGNWHKEKCCLLRPGDIVKIEKEEECSCDVLILKSSNDGGYLYLDTKNLDGETNLKEKCSLEEIKDYPLEMHELNTIVGEIETTNSDSNLNEWEGILAINGYTDIYCCIKNLVLKGSMLKNTEFVYAVVVYVGHDTKIMKNAKNPKPKTSKIMKTMNWILYTLFAFTLMICILFGALSVVYTNKNCLKYTYIFHKYDINDKNNHGGIRFFLNFLTFFIVYAQIIPISLYVVMEIIKLFQGILIKYDCEMYDTQLKKPAICRSTDLIEELGQIDFLFSDKTGTLTKNEMIFKKCFINGKIYGAEKDMNDQDTAKNTINGDFDAYDKLKKLNTDDQDKKDQEMIHLFFLSLTLCHDVFPEQMEDKIIYQGSSPDDIALVKGAQQFGYEFISKDFNLLTIRNQITNSKVQFDILNIIPFDSDRKRMSVIVKEKATGRIFIFCKGSDGIMVQGINDLPIISKFNYETEGKDALKILDCFSKEGLRILVMGYKEISVEAAEKWITKHDQARMKNQDLLNTIYEEIEKELTFLGCSAIEDKLQDGVPDTIKILMSCGIRIWMLTGDKQNTAEQIGRQCKLISSETNLVNLSIEEKDKNAVKKLLTKLIEKYNLGQFLDKKKLNLVKILKKLKEQSTIDNVSLIINGVSLNQILRDKTLSKMFFLIGTIAKSVICSRVSPKQKSQIVRLVKIYGDFVTLAIGDGANDVPMILESSIGVGIQGKEGTQAVRSADYAIGQFRFLEKFILFYGRNGYIKISKFICYYFYKNIILVITELCFAFYDGFSGQIYFADWLGTMFNAIFTSWPCLFTFAYEKEHSVNICKSYPILYIAGPKNALFNLRVFWTYIGYGIFHSLLCFYIPTFSMIGISNEKGLTMNHWRISTVSFSCIIHVVSFKLMIISEFWTVLSMSFTIASIAIYYIIVICLCTEFLGKIFQNELVGVAFDIFSDFKSLIIIILSPFIICLPDIILKQIQYAFFPSPSEYLTKYRHCEEFKKIILRDANKKFSNGSSMLNRSRKKEVIVNSNDSIIDDTNSPLKFIGKNNKENVIDQLNKKPDNRQNIEKGTEDKSNDGKQKVISLCPDPFSRNQIDSDIHYDNLNKPDEGNKPSNPKYQEHKSENDVVTNEIERNKSHSSYDIPDLYPANYLANKKHQVN